MKRENLYEIFLNRGWKMEKDDAGDVSFVIAYGGNKLSVTPSLRQLLAECLLEFDFSISSDEFDNLFSRVSGVKSYRVPIYADMLRLRRKNITADDVIERIDEMNAAFENFDADKEMRKRTGTPPNRPVLYQLLHLVALVYVHDIEKLSFYKKCFISGERLNFLPIVNIEMIERSISLASRK